MEDVGQIVVVLFLVLPAVVVWSTLLMAVLRHFPNMPFRQRLPLRIRGVDLFLIMWGWFVTVYLTMALRGWIVPTMSDRFALLALGNGALTVCIPVLFKKFRGIPYYQFGIHCSRWKESIAFGILQAAAWGPLCAAVNVMVRSQVVDRDPHPVEVFLQERHSAGEWALIAYCVVVAAPLMEELLFRGVLQAFLSRRQPAAVAIGVTSFFFGLAHGWPDVVPLVLFSVGLGVTYQRSRSLWAPVAMHATFNGCMLAIGALAGA